VLFGSGFEPVLDPELPPPTRVSAEHRPSRGMLLVKHGDDHWELPLMDTSVDAEIAGFVADVEVHQVFSNPFSERIEATYLFPLPDNSAVDDMVMQIGDRRIVGEIHRRDEARAIYEQARDSGRTAALLDQERPNMFTQHVANIGPGEQIDITIHFVQSLKYDDGGYEWAFPMVVGPRYIPAEGTGAANPREDAARLDAPYSRSTGNAISLQVSLDAGVPIQGLRSPSHKLLVERIGESQATIAIDPRDRIPNKDFILRYDVAGESPDAALITHRSGLGGYFMLMIQPQSEDALSDAVVTPKEMVFVVDTSCSMSGFPLDKARDAMRLAISEMNPSDRFTVLNFSEKVSKLSPQTLPNTSFNRRQGLRFVNQFRGSGGTEMLSGIKASLDLPADDDLLRTVLFLTDGYIGNEDAILAAIGERLGRSRLFSLGIGSSVNRYLLDRMAKMGRGQVQYLRPDEDASGAIEEFYDRIRNPVLTDIEVEWQGVSVEQVMPDPVPDLFAGQPIILVGRYDKPGRGSVTIRGRVRGQEVEQTIDVLLPRHQDENSALASLWARNVIADLESRQHGRPSRALVEEITDLALEYRLMSKYTSFVAVEEQIRGDGRGPTRTIRVPLEGPEFVDLDRTLGAKQQVVRRKAAPPHGGWLAAESEPSGSARSSRSRGSGRGLAAVLKGLLERSSGGASSSVGAESRVPAPEAADAADGEWLMDSLESDEVAREPAPKPRASAKFSVRAERSWPGLDQRRILAQVEQLMRPLQQQWSRDLASYPNGGEWRLRLHVDARGQVTRIEVTKDSLRHSGLRKLLRTFEGAWRLNSARTGSAVELDVVVRFSAQG
jgi:Ca-activated chloride channel family protein